MAQLSAFFRNSFRRRSSGGHPPPTTPGRALPQPPGRNPEGSRGAAHTAGQFFEYLAVVSLKKPKLGGGEYVPEITYQFPRRESLLQSQREEEQRLLGAMPLFCFPDGNSWAPLHQHPSETFSFVLTNTDGSRKFGYCRRVLPPGRGARLPLVYCIISCLGCFGLFARILEEVEKRHQIANAVIYPFMQALRESPFPAPGRTVTVKSFIPDAGPTEYIQLTRPLDSRLEHVDFRTLLQRVSAQQMLSIFGSAVLERRIIFLAEELSVLSQCTHAVAALLYPFQWEHTFIPVLPKVLIDTVCCPTPFMLGVQMQCKEQLMSLPMEEVLLVDLCSGNLLMRVGDEEGIVPPKLQHEMLSSLDEQRRNSPTPEQTNKHVSDTFMHFFVRTIGHYSSYIKRGGNQPAAFQEKSFCNGIKSKTIRRFVKKLVKTQMFSIFIRESEENPAQESYFHQKVIDYQRLKEHK